MKQYVKVYVWLNSSLILPSVILPFSSPMMCGDVLTAFDLGQVSMVSISMFNELSKCVCLCVLSIICLTS